MRERRTRSVFALGLTVLGSCLFVPDMAAQEQDPGGLLVGRWILTPLVSAQWGYDTNPFYSDRASGTDAESNSRLSLGVGATLPFRSSRLQIGYRRDLLRFERTRLIADTVDDLEGGLDLQFASSDRLGVRASWIEGVADTLRFDPGGETVFRGEPYRLRDITASASRENPARHGYEIRFSRRDLTFPEQQSGTDFFEYRGWDGGAEYRAPLGRKIWGTASYQARRYQHYCRLVQPSGEACPVVGEPFREEIGDALQVGVRGELAERSPYAVRLGWLDLRYRGSIAKGYEGPVWEGSLRVGLSRGMWVETSAARQVYSSFYLDNDFFTYTSAQARFGVNLSGRWELAVGALVSRAGYDTPDASGRFRRDDTIRADAYANLLLPHRFGIRFTVTDDHRTSTIEGLGYDRRTFFVGAFFGWL